MGIGAAARRFTNPYGSYASAYEWIEPPAPASRDAGPNRPAQWARPSGAADPSRGGGGPIGVVKLLRARGGCLGVIRIRAWKAAKSPGELPNERSSRNARGYPGN